METTDPTLEDAQYQQQANMMHQVVTDAVQEVLRREAEENATNPPFTQSANAVQNQTNMQELMQQMMEQMTKTFLQQMQTTFKNNTNSNHTK